MEPWMALGTACTFGFLHALELDHMLAVTTFVSRRPRLADAARFGARWGAGHGVAVFLLGGALLAAGLRIPPAWEAAGEGVVGLMLVALGAWALVSVRRLHLHGTAEHGDHAHLHVHAGSKGHVHGHRHGEPHGGARAHGGITLVGLVHGLAGTGGVLALVPVTLGADRLLGAGYLAAFAAGTVAAMTLFAVAAAVAMRSAEERSLAWGRRLTTAIGAAGVLVGAFWMARAGGLA